MKRLALILLLAVPMFGLTRPLPRGTRIAVLPPQDSFTGPYQSVASLIDRELRAELNARGLDAFATRASFADLQHGEGPAADYFVEISGTDAAQHAIGDVGTASGNIGIDVGVVVARVAAELRVYDGRTLELLDRFNLRHNTAGVVPAGVGVARRPIWMFVILPFVHFDGYRAAARNVAHEAADLIAQR